MLLLYQIAFFYIISTHITDAASLICYQNSINNQTELPLDKADAFMDTGLINTECTLVIVIHGYSSEITPFHLDILTAYMEKYGDEYCYCALNWKTEATAYIGSITGPIKNALGIKIAGIDYPAVSLIALAVADQLAVVLVKMQSKGLPLSNVFLMPHSEGDCLSGNAGRRVIALTKGQKIGKIMAMDPPKQPIEPPLDKYCATFVSVIHSDPGGLGTTEAQGVVDFWINYGCKVQPGCKCNTLPLTYDSLCSHQRSLFIIADAVRNPDSLMGRRAANYSDWVNNEGTPDDDDINYIGPNINENNSGSFYLCTNAASVYGKGPDGMVASKCICSPQC